MNFKGLELPNVLNVKLPKARSLYKGPYSKGDFKFNSVSLKNSPDTSPHRTPLRQREDNSPLNFEILAKRDSDIEGFEKFFPKGSISSRDFSSPSKRQAGQKTPRISLLSQIPAETPSNIKVYLDYLDTTPARKTANFTFKMRNRSENRKEAQKPSKDNSIEYEPLVRHESDHKGDSISTIRAPKTSVNSKNSMDLRLSTLSKKDPSRKTSRDFSTRGSYSSFRNLEMFRGRESKLTQVKHSTPDEIAVKLLSEEIVKNYQEYSEGAAKTGEFRHRMEEFMKMYGVFSIFDKSLNQESTLASRLYKDMFEWGEPKISDSLVSSRTAAVWSHSQISLRKTRPRPKMIEAKYQTYKVINAELIEVNVDFKVHKMQSLGKKLSEAHENLIAKKNEVFRKVSKISISKYNSMKEDYEDVRYPVSLDSSPAIFGNKRDINFETTVNMRINQGLDNAILMWRKNFAHLT